MTKGKEERLAPEEEKMIEEYWKDLETLPVHGSSRLTQFPARLVPIDEEENRRIKDKMDLSNIINHDESSEEPSINNQNLNNPSALLDISNNVLEERHERVPAGFPDCALCPQKFELHSKLEEHLILEHGYPTPKCPHCDYTSPKIVKMKRHIKVTSASQVAHDADAGRYHCFACKYSCDSVWEIKNHTRNQHSRCPYCQRGFERLGTHERGCALHPKYAYKAEYFRQHNRLPPN